MPEDTKRDAGMIVERFPTVTQPAHPVFTKVSGIVALRYRSPLGNDAVRVKGTDSGRQT